MLDIDGMLAAAAGEASSSSLVPQPASPLPAMTIGALPYLPPAPLPDLKRQEVADTTEDKKVALGGFPSPQVFRNAAIARATGSGKASSSGVEADLATLSYGELVQKYGDQAHGMFMSLAAAESNFRAQAANPRTAGDRITDTATGVVGGLAGSITGIAALGAGVVNADAGRYVADKAQELNRWIEGTQSPGLNARREANRDRGALDTRDTSAQFSEDVKKDGEFVASLKRIGQDAINAVGNVIEDPTLLSDGVAQGVGSVLAAGPVTKVLSKVGKAALGAKLSPTAATSLSIGAMESGGSYVDTVQGLTDMTHEELMERSPGYARMVQNGRSREDAKAAIINKAGLLAAAATAPAAVAAGRLVAKFEGNPLHVPNLRSAAGNLIREAVEEGAQGATGQLSQNLAVQNVADNTRTLSEGVGEQVGLGALYGFGAAGALQAPGAARRSALSTVMAAGKGAMAVVEKASEMGAARLDALKTQNEKSSPVSSEILKQASEEVIQSAPQAMEVLKTEIDKTNAPPEAKTAAMEAADRLVGSIAITPEEVQALPENLRPLAEGAKTRFSVLQSLANLLTQPEISQAVETDPRHPSQRLEIAKSLIALMDPLLDAYPERVETLGEIPQDSAAGMVLQRINALVSNIQTNTNLNSALTKAQQSLLEAQQKGEIKPVTPESLNTPEGTKNAELAIAVATVDPAKADLPSVNLMASMAQQGKLKLTANQYASLLTAQAVLTAAAKAKEEQTRLGHTTPIQDVGDQILTAQRKSGENPSATAHALNVFRAMQTGNVERAKTYLEDFGNFVGHMVNKMNAVNVQVDKPIARGENRTFRAYDPEKKAWYNAKAPILHAHNATSVGLAQTINLEAQQLLDVYNALSQAFPQLKGMKFKPVAMPQALQPQQVNQGGGDSSSSSFPGSSTDESTESAPPPKVGEHLPREQQSQPDLLGGEEVFPDEMEAEETRKDRAIAFNEGTDVTPGYDIKGNTDKDGVYSGHWYSNMTVDEALRDFAELKPKEQADRLREMAFEYAADPTSLGDKANQDRYLELIKRLRAIATSSPIENQKENTTEDASQEATPATLKDTYPALFGAGTFNHFLRAFSLPKEIKSRLTTLTAPLAAVVEAFSSPAKLMEFSGGVYGERTNTEAMQAMGTYLALAPQVLAKLNERLQENLTRSRGKKTLLQAMQDDPAVTRWINAKQLNLVEAKGDTFAYNEGLAEMAVLGALQWVLSSSENENTIDDRTAASIAGIEVDEVTDELMAKLTDGQTTVAAVNGLTAKIRAYWGLDTNRNVERGFTEGIPEAMAKEVLASLVQLGFVKESTIEINEKTIDIYAPNWERKDTDPINKIINGLDKAILVKPQDVRHFSPETIEIPETQLRNSMVKNSPEAKAAIKTANETPYFLNPTMTALYEKMGVGMFLELFGHGNLSKRVLNKAHRESLEGKNRGLMEAYRSFIGLAGEIKNLAKSTSIEPHEQPIHYAHNMHRAGRLQQLGGFTPQNNKEIREAVVSTWSQLDLSDPSSQHYQMFMLSLAQSLGISIHKMKRVDAIAKVQGWLEGKALAKSLSILAEFQDGGDITSAQIQTLRADLLALGQQPTARAINALMEYARFKETTPEERKEFTTPAYIEADGVTNGPINAMMLLSVGAFTPDWVDRMKKGGLYFNSFKSLNDYFTSGKVQDLYETTTTFFQKYLGKIQAAVSKNGKATEHFNALKDMLDIFLPGFQIQGDQLVINRNVAKNPLTITIYGSGTRGIAGKIRDTVLDALYEHMSEAAQRQKDNPNLSPAEALFGDHPNPNAQFARFTDAFEKLGNQELAYTKAGWIFRGPKPYPFKFTGFETFAVDSIRQINMRENIRNLFVSPLNKAITETLGEELTRGKNLIQTAGQIQSMFQEALFKDLHDDLLAKKLAKDPTFVKSIGLTENELTEIHRKVLERFPMITTQEQTFYPAGSQSTESNTSYSQTLDDKLKTPGFVPGPQDAGVATTPLLTIGFGDGLAIQKLLAAKDAPQDALTIYDGVHYKLSSMSQDNVKTNRAVFESWRSNPIKALSEAFSKSLPGFKLDMLSPAQRERLELSLSSLGVDDLSSLGSQLEQASKVMDARMRAIARVSHTIDQLAAVEAPYVNQGETITQTTDEGIAGQLNLLLSEELSKGEKKEDTLPQGVQIYAVNDLSNLIKGMELSPIQKAIYDQVQIAKAASGYTVVTGSVEDLLAYARDRDFPLPNLTDRTLGVTSTQAKTIYLVNPSQEVVVHELIHAATLETVLGVKQGTETNPQIIQAVSRLEQLKEEFLSLDPGLMSSEEAQAYANGKAAIEQYQDPENGPTTPEQQTLALNEFMAWGLANQKLASLQAGSGDEKVLAKVVRNVLTALKSFFFGGVQLNTKDMLSRLLFNTSVLMQAEPTVAEKVAPIMAYMSTAYGDDARIDDINTVFQRKITQYLTSGPTTLENLSSAEAQRLRDDPSYGRILRNVRLEQGIENARKLAQAAEAHGFVLTPQARTAFHSIVSGLAVETSIDPTALSQAQSLYTHVARTTTVQDFMKDPEANDPNDYARAEARYNFLIGRSAVKFDEQNRSSLMPVFLALAMVDNNLRAVLSKIDLPKTAKNTVGTLDAKLENLGNYALDKLSERLSNTNRAANVQQAADALATRIQDLAQEQDGIITRLTSPGGTFVDQVNAFVVKGMETLAEKAVSKTEALKNANPNSKTRKALAATTNLVASIVSEKRAEIVAQGVMAALNNVKGFDFVRTLASDLIGRTNLNKNVFDLIKEVRSDVQQDRQHYREILPTIIANSFSRKLSDGEWTSIFKGMAKTDLAALTNLGTVSDALDLLSNARTRRQRISALESQLRQQDPAHWNQIEAKAKQLATYMNTGIAGNFLLRNAYAVARLYGQPVQRNRPTPNDRFITELDHLISLYAVEGLTQSDKDALSTLVKDEREGMTFALSYLQGQRKDEMSKAHGRGRLNHHKGYIPSLQENGHSLIVIRDANAASYLERSYTRVGDYTYTGAEIHTPSMGYYYAPVQGRMPFSQGIFQNVQQTVGGVDPTTGYTLGNMAGRITDPVEVKAIQRRIGRQNAQTQESLLPVLDESGRVMAFERTMDPAQVAKLNQDTHLARMIGVWRGRQVEEAKANIFNERLIHALKEMYDTDLRKNPRNASQYVSLYDAKELVEDPVLFDAVKLLTRETIEYANEVFDGPIMVRRDLLKDVVGQRKASIVDSWTGITRYSEKTRNHIKNITTLVMGNDAYKWLLTGENEIRNLVANAKQIIVVKSVIVPTVNFVSNLLHMATRGVPALFVAQAMPKKLAEVTTYTRNIARRIEAEAELRAVSNKPFEARKLQAEIQSIDDSNRRLTIWPLIEAGEFSSISDAGISRDELLLSQGKLTSYITKLTDRLPESVKRAGRYALITKDTALFQGLQKAVQYGDFLAKAVMYDDLIGRQKKSKEEALGQITEEFINYDRLPGRTRGYLEDLGLLWFYNYKIRAVKIAASVLRNNPVNALLTSLVPMPDMLSSLGTPLDDNLISKGIAGKLPYSIGPSMGFHAPALHPIHQLFR